MWRDVSVADNRFVDKYTLGCGGLIAFSGLLIAGVILWAFWDARPDSIEIRNESGRTVVVSPQAGLCESLLDLYVPSRTSATFEDGWLRCNKPGLSISPVGTGTASCLWDDAYADQPVVVTDDSVSCDHDGIWTTEDEYPSPNPTNVPSDNSPADFGMPIE